MKMKTMKKVDNKDLKKIAGGGRYRLSPIKTKKTVTSIDTIDKSTIDSSFGDVDLDAMSALLKQLYG